MSPSEIAFLALGLVFGAAIGAALFQAVRAKPARRREVRLTITPNAIPARRAQTLAVVRGSEYPGLIPGSPEDGALADLFRGVLGPGPALAAATPAGGMPSRTRVPTGPVVLPATTVGVPVGAPPPGAAREPLDHAATGRDAPGDAPRAVAGPAPGAMTAVAVLDAPARDAAPPRPAEQARPAPGDAFTMLVRPRPPADETGPSLGAGSVAVATRVATRVETPADPARRPVPLPEVRLAPPSGPTLTRPRAAAGPPATPDPGGAAVQASTAAEPCAGPRRMVEERCALADVARDQARRAADALREAQRTYDVLRERVDRAEATADPRRIAAEKERLHATFRGASDRAATPDDTEAAARAWLNEVNQLNAAVREAQRIIEAGGADLRAQLPVLERLAAEADAARIAAENAEAGCREAREDLAGCEEAEARARQAPAPKEEEPHPFARVWPLDSPNLPAPASTPTPGELMAGLPLVIRVLRGDREARDRLVATLAAGDADGEREWGLRISRLIDAIVGRAIEDGYLDLPDDDPFWRLFERREARDIVGSLSALGFRYDGLGGFADGRVPAARDLSLAVGYAGLDRMRIRTWPRESDLGSLYERAVVAADEWLADQASDLSLGRMVDALGGRAAELADVWNAWGRVRPALLAS